MNFTKMQGAGNDFIIINNIEEQLWAGWFEDLAHKLCCRRMAIGADGFMVIEKPEQGGDFKMLFYNADGSMGEMCGNGARCIAKYGFEHGLAGEEINIETTAGMVKAWRLDQMQYKVRLNDVTRMDLDMELEALGETYVCSYVELGDPAVPHLVVEMKGLSEREPKTLWELGKELRCHKALPKGANVNFYEIMGRDQIFERTFERGVEDFTYACGTGTGSVVGVLTKKGLVSGKKVKVSMTGGDLFIDADLDSGQITDLYLTGPATIVAEGQVGELVNDRGNLVRLLDLDPDFIVDLKYAASDNFTGQKIYSTNQCYMDRHTAEILIRAKDIFRRDGYRVKVMDAYRPISAQEKFWEILPDNDYIAMPPDMGKLKSFRPTHLNGLCVDITLTDLDGNEIEMPSEFDDFSEKASLLCQAISETGRRHAEYMKDVMEGVGFQAYENEWWHFYDVTTEPVPFLNFQI